LRTAASWLSVARCRAYHRAIRPSISGTSLNRFLLIVSFFILTPFV
jgi:hypothetical protein